LIETVLADYGRLIEPDATHWQHPGLLAYFGTTASGAGIIGEMLTAALGQFAMLWRTAPIATELEGVVVGVAPPGARPARRLRRSHHRHGLDVVR
jgi:aromatic-L-amino-acid decarboxylase